MVLLTESKLIRSVLKNHYPNGRIILTNEFIRSKSELTESDMDVIKRFIDVINKFEVYFDYLYDKSINAKYSFSIKPMEPRKQAPDFYRLKVNDKRVGILFDRFTNKIWFIGIIIKNTSNDYFELIKSYVKYSMKIFKRVDETNLMQLCKVASISKVKIKEIEEYLEELNNYVNNSI